MNEKNDLIQNADELVWHALQTGDLGVTSELRKINDRIELINRKRVDDSLWGVGGPTEPTVPRSNSATGGPPE